MHGHIAIVTEVGMGIGTLSEIDHHSHIHKHSKTVGMGIGTLPEIDHHSHIHNHSKTVGMGIGTLPEIDHHSHIHKHSKTVGMGIGPRVPSSSNSLRLVFSSITATSLFSH